MLCVSLLRILEIVEILLQIIVIRVLASYNSLDHYARQARNKKLPVFFHGVFVAREQVLLLGRLYQPHCSSVN